MMTLTPEELLDRLKYDITTGDNGTTTTYRFNGEIHRDDDLPAVIFADGTKWWYQSGVRHRDDDQPAVIHASGSKFWYKDGTLHRDDDQPAVIYADGTKEWYKNGMRIKKR